MRGNVAHSTTRSQSGITPSIFVSEIRAWLERVYQFCPISFSGVTQNWFILAISGGHELPPCKSESLLGPIRNRSDNSQAP